MLVQVLGIKAVKIPSQYIYALSMNSEHGDFILPAFDAKKGRVFGALYKNNNSKIEIVVSPGDYLINYLLSKIPVGAKVICSGDGCEKFRSAIVENIVNPVILEKYLPSGINSLKYISDMIETGGLDIIDYNKILPDYTRKSDAEIAMEAGKI